MQKTQSKMVEALRLADEAVDQELGEKTLQRVISSMARAREKGKTQWWNPALCKVETLRQEALAAAERQDFEAMLMFSAMVLYRTEVTVP